MASKVIPPHGSDTNHVESYWESKPCTVQAVLGGFEEISDIDIEASAKFLQDLGFQSNPSQQRLRVLDNGAGIGRVVKDLFLGKNMFEIVDASESSVKYAEELRKIANINEVFLSDLQTLELPSRTYNLIWNQWVLMYLSDDELHVFLEKCKTALASNGLICIKENVILGSRARSERDDEDGSVVRYLVSRLFRESEFLSDTFNALGLCTYACSSR